MPLLLKALCIPKIQFQKQINSYIMRVCAKTALPPLSRITYIITIILKTASVKLK